MHCLSIQKISAAIHKIQSKLSSHLDWNAFELFLRDTLHEFIEQTPIGTLSGGLRTPVISATAARLHRTPVAEHRVFTGKKYIVKTYT